MKRRRPQPEEAKLSLFPFLDVLLCTMGTLIILLIVITNQAWRSAEQAPSEPPAPTNSDDNPQAWQQRVAQLESAHGDVSDAVKQRRVELGYLEQNTRKLQVRMVELQAMLLERKRLSESKAESVEQAADEVKHLEARIAEAQKDLDALRQENKDKPAAYSIIPYEGPNKTPRRPVYIECRAKDVVLQPEGIILQSNDFILSTDPGNPLVTVLRATREYLAGGKSLAAEQEPYPLIIVRPDGIESYYAVRQSLQGWATDFGYEMVDRDWKLKFPPADPSLVVAQNQALAEARLRQKGLIAMIARRSRRGPTFTPAVGGGILREEDGIGGGGAGIPVHGNADEAEDTSFGTPGFDPNRTADGKGNAAAGGNSLAGGAGQGTGGQGTGGQGSGGAASGGLIGTAAPRPGAGGSASAGGPDLAAGNGMGKPGSSKTGQGDARLQYGDASTQPGGNGRAGAASGDPNQQGDSASEIAQRDAARGNAAGSAPRPPGHYDGTSGPGGTASAGAAGESDGSGGSGGGPSNSGSGGGYTGGTPDVDNRDNKNKPNPHSIAKARGRDWALQYAEPTATAVTRPLRVMCYADRLVIVTGDAHRGNKEVILKTSTRDSVDDFASNVRAEIKTWGIAGKGMYWKPILSFDVQQGGEARYEEFRKLFDGSGFDVRRRAPSVARAVNTTTRYR
jgi:hypothetical protein